MIWVDNVRVIATFAVVFLHVAANVVLNVLDLDNFAWLTGNLYDSSVRWCVPAFVMISGFLLLDQGKTESLFTFYRKRSKKILIPLFFFTIFYTLWNITGINGHVANLSLKYLFKSLIFGSSYYHMWYLYMVLVLYIFTPFLRKLVSILSIYEVIFLCIVMFLVALLSTIIQNYFLCNTLFMTQFLLFLPYLLSGYIIGNIKKYCYKGVAVLIYFSAVLFTAYGCYLFSVKYDFKHGAYFYNYLSISVIPMSLSIFYLMRSINKYIVSGYVIRKLASLSLGIYLIHPIYIDILRYYGIKAESLNQMISIPLIASIVFSMSAITALLMSKVRYVRRLI